MPRKELKYPKQIVAWLKDWGEREHRLGRKRLLDTQLAAALHQTGIYRIVTQAGKILKFFGYSKSSSCCHEFKSFRIWDFGFRNPQSAFQNSQVSLIENTDPSVVRLALEPRMRIRLATGVSLGRQWPAQKQNSLSAVKSLKT